MLSNLLVSQVDIGAVAASQSSLMPCAMVSGDSWVIAAVGGLAVLFAFGIYSLVRGDELDRFR